MKIKVKLLIFLFSICDSIFNAAVDASQANSKAISEKIIGGQNADIRDFPYIVSLWSEIFKCTGSIISEWHILTAAHCVIDSYSKTPVHSVFRAGSSYRNKDGSLLEVAKFAVHKNFRFIHGTMAHADLAIFKLTKRIQIDNITKKVINMSEPGIENEPGSTALAAGWGWIDYHGTSPEQLQSVQVQIFDENECTKVYSKTFQEGQICAGSPDKQKIRGVAPGDSGGPLVIDGKLAGFTSYGQGNSSYLQVFVDVSYFRDWIDDKMADNSSLSIKPSSIEEYPYLVTLVNAAKKNKTSLDYPWCTGSILSPLYILTAASCVYSKDEPNNYKKFLVRVGSSKEHRLANWTIHPDYNGTHPSGNDIALLKLSDKIEFDYSVTGPIVLFGPNDTVSLGEKAVQPGWWWIKSSGWFYPKQLHSLQLEVVDCTRLNTICAEQSHNTFDLTDTHDGGPLIINHKLAGIMSYLDYHVASDNTSYQINGYTEVSYFREWIDRLIEC